MCFSLQLLHFNYLDISRTLYFIVPAGAKTSISWPFFAPNKAAPIGDSFDILFCARSTSVEPTIVYSNSSSNSSSKIFTLLPTCTVLLSISDSSIILAYLTLFSNSAIFISFAACAFLASSYSEFSDKSPNPNATFILSEISALFSVFKYSSSFSRLSYPSCVYNISFSSIFNFSFFDFYSLI